MLPTHHCQFAQPPLPSDHPAAYQKLPAIPSFNYQAASSPQKTICMERVVAKVILPAALTSVFSLHAKPWPFRSTIRLVRLTWFSSLKSSGYG